MKTPSPALVTSCVALAVALGGTGYALTALPKNSVGTKQIKNNAVTGAKIKAGSVEASDLKAGVLAAATQGLVGPQGPTGPQGTAGPAGPQGPSEVAYASSSTATLVATTDVPVIQLATDGVPLVLPGNRRVLVQATIAFRRAYADRATPVRIGCTGAWGAQGAALTPLSSSATTRIMPAMPGATFNTVDSLTLTYSIPLSAGTWNIGVLCDPVVGDTVAVTAVGGAINVIAAAPPAA